MTGFSSLPGTEDAQEDSQNFRGIPRILGPRWAHLPIVTFGLFGVQIFWSVELSYGMLSSQIIETRVNIFLASPYLLSLGLSKSSMAIVFLAGPLSGLIVQPLIGLTHQFLPAALSDTHQVFLPMHAPHLSAGDAHT